MHNSTPLSALRNLLLAQGLDGMIVPRADAHQSEDCTPHDNKLARLTGFSGSAGLALVLRDRALMFVDGRYRVQSVTKSPRRFRDSSFTRRAASRLFADACASRYPHWL